MTEQFPVYILDQSFHPGVWCRKKAAWEKTEEFLILKPRQQKNPFFKKMTNTLKKQVGLHYAA